MVSKMTLASKNLNCTDFFSATLNMELELTSLSDCDEAREPSGLEEVMNSVYVVLSGIFSVLSIFGTVTIISTYVCYPELRSRGRHFLVFLSAADFLTAFGNLLGVIWTADPDGFSEAFCKVS